MLFGPSFLWIGAIMELSEASKQVEAMRNEIARFGRSL